MRKNLHDIAQGIDTMAIESSWIKALSSLKTSVSEKLQKLVAFIFNRKVEILSEFDVQIPPDHQTETKPSSKPLSSRRKRRRRKKALPEVKRSSEETKQLKNQLLRQYSPNGDKFKSAMAEAKLGSYEELNTDFLADYADRVNAYVDAVSPEAMEQLLPLDLALLVADHLQAEPVPIPEMETPKPVVTVKTKKLSTLDQTLSCEVAALNWLHSNHKAIKVDLQKSLVQMAGQANLNRRNLYGKSRHITEMARAYCVDKNLDGLMAYAHNFRDNGVKPFDSHIMNEIEIQLFQRDLIKHLQQRATGNTDNVTQLALEAATKGNWNDLATYLSIDSSLTPPISCFRRLESVIPDYSTHRVDQSSELASYTASLPEAPYYPPVEEFTALEQNTAEDVSMETIAARLRKPGPNALGQDGRMAYLRVEIGLERKDFDCLSGGLLYLLEDQHYHVVDSGIHRSLRYRELKQKVENHLSQLAVEDSNRNMKRKLNQAIGQVTRDQWSSLGELDQLYHDHYGKPLFDTYLMGQIKSYNRLQAS